RDDIEEVREGLKIARQEVVPFGALQFWLVVAVEVNHLPDVGIIPSAERYPGNQIFLVNETKSAGMKLVIVVTAELVKADARLAKCVDTVDLSSHIVLPHGEDGASERGQRGAKAMTGQPERALRFVRHVGRISADQSLGHYFVQGGLNFHPGVEQRVTEAGVDFTNLGRSLK